MPEPTDGDVRLVPLNGTAVPTAACDEVHFGGVELFREGRWGRICSGRGGDEPADFALDAEVICRQLGFPFGTVMDEVDNAEFDTSSSETPPTIWASSVRTFTFCCPVFGCACSQQLSGHCVHILSGQCERLHCEAGVPQPLCLILTFQSSVNHGVLIPSTQILVMP